MAIVKGYVVQQSLDLNSNLLLDMPKLFILNYKYEHVVDIVFVCDRSLFGFDANDSGC